MKFSENRSSILSVGFVSLLLPPGLVVLAWGFQILSYPRLLITSLVLFPAIVLAVVIFNRFFSIRFINFGQKQTIVNLGISLGMGLIVIRSPMDPLRYLATLFFAACLFFFIGSAFVIAAGRGMNGLLRRLFRFGFLLAGLAGVSTFLYMSLFSRLYGDDFCFTFFVKSSGFLPALYHFYNNWSGRAFSDLFMFGFSSAQKMPLIEMLLLIGILYFILYRNRSNRKEKFSLSAASAAVFLPFIIFSAIPDPYKSLVWITNTALIFPVSLVFLFFVGFMARGFQVGFQPDWSSVGAAFVLALAISSGHEIVVPAILLVIGAFLLLAFFHQKQSSRMPLIVSLGALAGAVAGALIVVLAPGNYVRMAAQGYPPPPDLFRALDLSFRYFAGFLAGMAENWRWVLMLAAAAAGINAETHLPKNWKIFTAILIVTLGAVWGTFLVSTFAMSNTLPTRTQFIPIFLLVLGFFGLGVALPLPKPQAGLTIFKAAVLLSLGFVFTQVIQNDLKLVAPMEQFARDWDVRDRKLRFENGQAYSIEIPWDSTEQAFECMKAYYSQQLPR